MTQLIKLWGGYVVTACRTDAVPVMKALGADEIIIINETDIEKELQLHDKYEKVLRTRFIIYFKLPYLNKIIDSIVVFFNIA